MCVILCGLRKGVPLRRGRVSSFSVFSNVRLKTCCRPFDPFDPFNPLAQPINGGAGQGVDILWLDWPDHLFIYNILEYIQYASVSRRAFVCVCVGMLQHTSFWGGGGQP